MPTQIISWGGLERYQHLFDLCPVGCIIATDEGDIVEVNQKTAQILNRNKDFFNGKNLNQFIEEKDLGLFYRSFSELEPSQLIISFKLPDSTSQSFQTTIATLPTGDGLQNLFQVILQTTTEDLFRINQASRDEEHYRNIVELSPQPIWVQSDRRVAYCNDAAAKLLGADSKEALVNKPINEILHPDFHEVADRKTERVLEKNDVASPIEEKLVRLDGKVLDVEVVATRIRYKGQNVIQILIQDITPRKQVEAALRTSEERFRTFMDNTPTPVFIKDQDGSYVYLNQAIENLVQTPREQLLGKTIFNRLPEDIAHHLTSNDAKVLSSLQSQQFQENILAADGSLRSQIVIKFPLKDIDGRVLIAGIAVDITEQKRAEKERDALFIQAQAEYQAAEAAREYFVNLLDSITDGFFTLDRNWRFIYVNSSFEKIVSRSRDELVGSSIWEQFPEAQMTLFYKEYKRAMEEQLTSVFEAYYPAFEAWYAVRVYPTSEGISVFILDITARKQAETTRQDLLKRLTTAQEEERWRIARDLHDQLGQDLAVLMLGLKALPKYGTLSPSAEVCIQELQSTVVHLMRQVRHVALNLRSEALGVLGLPTALQRYTEEWSRHHNIPVTIHSWGFQGRRVAPYIEATIYRIIQEAFTNVLRHSNAKNVSVVLEHRSDYILAIVEDDGQGFDVESVLGQPLTERGLGLQGMKERMALVDGTLQIESNIGDGTTIYLRLPSGNTTDSLQGLKEG